MTRTFKFSSFLFILILGAIGKSAAQKVQDIPLCAPHPHSKTVPSDYPGKVIIDRFGNAYTEEELLGERAMASSTCNSGIFQLNFIGSFPTDEEQTICQVFGDLSSTIAGSSTVSIPINIVREPQSYGAPATATDFFMVQCGLANSSVLQLLTTGQSGLPIGIAAGVVHVRQQPTATTTWHSLQDDVNPITTGEVDLYSVVVHEALHILGFASLIGLDGTPVGSGAVYSNWDRFLYSTAINQPLIRPTGNGPCCNSHAFNTTGFPNMPQSLTGGCNLNIAFYDGTNALAPVNNATLVPASDNDMANKLSHLDISCGTGEQYVMNPGIAPGVTRRSITGAELRILCNLGYTAAASCNNCLVIAQDDNLPNSIIMAGVNANNPMTVPFATVLANDVYPAGATVQLKPNCGQSAGINVVQQGNAFVITGTQSGIWTFCYTITGCNGNCEEAQVTVIVQSSAVETQCESPNCELVCFGDFEDFTTGTGVYNQQIGIPNFFVQGSGGGDNSLDIWDDGNGNQVLRWVRVLGGSWECARIPLAAPIEPNCTIIVHYDAAAGPFGSNPANPSPLIYMVGTSGPPCTSINEPISAGVFNLCSGVQGVNIDIHNTPFFPGNTGINNLQPVNFTWTNTTGFPVTDILLYGYFGAGGSSNYQYFLDNLSIIDLCCSVCDPVATIHPTVREACVDGQIVIDYEVCINPPGSGPTTITLQPAIPAIPGLSVVPGGGFNASGVATVTLPDQTGDPNCTTVTLTLNVGSNVQPGTPITIDMHAYSTEGCIDEVTFNGGDVTVKVIDCDTCDIEVRKDCRQRNDGSWYAYVTLYHNGLPIQNVNDPDCCVTWEYLNGIPTIPCPRPNGMPNMNFTPMSIPEDRHYRVTIVCDDCTYIEEGVIDCDPKGPGRGARSGVSNDVLDANGLATIYPNPAQNQLAVKIKESSFELESYDFELFDAYGRQVLRHQMSDETKWQIIDISTFTPGVYAWRLIGRNSETTFETGKVLVIK